MTSVPERIKEFNAGRNPQTLALKYQAMRQDVFSFYRGSCHLFYQDLAQQSCLQQSPLTWVCGDLHLENFGAYKTDHRKVYLNINDFDESVLAPCLFDISRLLTSILLAANSSLNIDEKTASQLCKRFLKIYTQTLESENPQLLDEKSASGEVEALLEHAEKLKRKDFVKTRIEKNTNPLKLLIDNKRTFEISLDLKQELANAIAKWTKQQTNLDVYQVLDAAGRIAGTGSLGLTRYTVLVKAEEEDNPRLLDIKIANKSCLTPSLKTAQPLWKNEAERIVQIQTQHQVFPPALLNVIEFKQQWFVLKELQSSQYKIDYTEYQGKPDKLNEVIEALAKIVAWNQLRISDTNNCANSYELIAFANSYSEWKQPLLNECEVYAKQTKKDYQQYCKAYDEGCFSL